MMTPVLLTCIDPARNMHRFYLLDIAPDLFGGFLCVRQWGRIGTRGRITAERYDSAELALSALAKHAARKARRGYVGNLATAADPPETISPTHRPFA
jgi:predicted DNA-binding WGR domain protein